MNENSIDNTSQSDNCGDEQTRQGAVDRPPPAVSAEATHFADSLTPTLIVGDGHDVGGEMPPLPQADEEGDMGNQEFDAEEGDTEEGTANALLYPLSTNSVQEASEVGDHASAYPLPRLSLQRPPRPVAPRMNFQGLPANLPQGRHYLLWKYGWVDDKGTKNKVSNEAPENGASVPKGRWTKTPCGQSGYRIDATDTANLLTLEDVQQVYEEGLNAPNASYRFDGIGLSLDLDLGIVALDLDHQRGADGKWSEVALSIIASVNSYSEFSPSGAGVRILVFGKLPTDEIKNGDFENFEQKHYVTLTGMGIPGTPALIEPRQEEVAAYHMQYVVKPRRTKSGAKRPTPPGSASRLTKEQILEKAARGKSGAKFIDFYRQGPDSPLAPQKGDDSPDQSVMDLFVCGVLAKFSGGNAEMMDEMMRESALMRDKWDKRIGKSSYGQLTIAKAIAGCREFFDPLAPEFEDLLPDAIPVAKGTGRNGAPTYSAYQIVELLHPEWEVQAIDTHAAHAQRIAHYLSGELCHVDGLGWLGYNERHWEVDSRGNKRTLARVAKLSKYVRAEVTYLYELAAKLSGAGRASDAAAMGEAAKSLGTLTRTTEDTGFMKESIELAAGRLEISRHMREFEPKEWLIPFKNFVWDAGAIRAHRSEDCVLQLCPVEVDLDRLAYIEAQLAQTSSGDDEIDGDIDVALGPWKGTEWGQVLERITGGDPRLARTLQEVAGYVLSGAPYLRIIVWAYGAKGTGKGTFTELLKTMMGDNAVTLDPKSLSPRGDRERLGARVAHKRLGVCPEAGNKQFDAELLKTHSGADTLNARYLFNEAFDAAPHHVLLLVSNHAPRLEANDPALKERILVLPFTHAMGKVGEMALTGGMSLEQVRRQANSPLAQEFALWALVGARRVMESGQVFRAPHIESAIGEFWKETDTMRRFWETVPLDKLDRGMFQSEMRTLYHLWCEGMHIPPQYRLADASFRGSVKERGLQEVRLTRDNIRSWKLPPDPNRVCSRLVTDPQTGRQVVAKLNIFGEEVVNGDSGGHPVFADTMYKKEDFNIETDDRLDDLLTRLNIPTSQGATRKGVPSGIEDGDEDGDEDA